MTEIQIPDPDPEDEPSRGAEAAAGGPRVVEGADEGDGSGAPYRNLLVPLVVVPALIVMVLVMVYALFGAILGEESTPRENVQRLLQGGVNEREQAAFALVRQFLEARQEGAEPWDLDPGLLPEIQRAHRASSELEEPGDVPPYLALTLLLVWMDDPMGVEHLAALTRLEEAQDPEGVFRSYAAYALGNFGEGYEAAEQRAAREALFQLIEGEDRALRVVSAGALQTLPGPETVGVLTSLLQEPDLDLRGSAALSLAHLGNDAGAAVLTELAVSTEPYETERAADPQGRRWTKAVDVSQSRQKALAALAHIDRLPDKGELERLAEEDPDGDIRALARRLASDPDAGP